MFAVGIIAEFDPLHNGHKYLLKRARELGGTHIAVVLSGSAVQRGEPAAFDKFSRAAAALENGADLVIELPAPYSCSNAEVFAGAGVSALAALGRGAVSGLIFGCENDDTALILRAADAADALKESSEVKDALKSGLSYPAALAFAAEERFGREIAEVFSQPNSTLALEYCRAVRRIAPWIEPAAVKRIGAGHNASGIQDSIASGSEIRALLRDGGDASGLMPPIGGERSDPQAVDKILLYRLMTARKRDLLALPDVDEALADRVLKTAAEPFDSSAGLLAACKSRNITLARLRRMALHLVLGVRAEDIAPLPFLRILAFNSRGRELLAAGEHTLPADTSLVKLEKTSAQAQCVSRLERAAGALRALGTPSGIYENEYRRAVRMTEI